MRVTQSIYHSPWNKQNNDSPNAKYDCKGSDKTMRQYQVLDVVVDCIPVVSTIICLWQLFYVAKTALFDTNHPTVYHFYIYNKKSIHNILFGLIPVVGNIGNIISHYLQDEFIDQKDKFDLTDAIWDLF